MVNWKYFISIPSALGTICSGVRIESAITLSVISLTILVGHIDSHNTFNAGRRYLMYGLHRSTTSLLRSALKWLHKIKEFCSRTLASNPWDRHRSCVKGRKVYGQECTTSLLIEITGPLFISLLSSVLNNLFCDFQQPHRLSFWFNCGLTGHSGDWCTALRLLIFESKQLFLVTLDSSGPRFLVCVGGRGSLFSIDCWRSWCNLSAVIVRYATCLYVRRLQWSLVGWYRR